MQIILIGFMGSGKTTIARKLSRYLKTPWVDLDKYIMNQHQMTINEIFEQKGQAEFRKMEYEALAELIQHDCIIATGGGVIEDVQTTHLIKHAQIPIIFLDGPFGYHWNRISRNDKRPLVNQLGHDGIFELYKQRHPKYYHLAHYTVYFAHKTPNMMVQEIELQLPRLQKKIRQFN